MLHPFTLLPSSGFCRSLIIGLALLLAGLTAQAQTTTWTGAINAVWDNPGNWSAGVPTTTLDAVIPSGPTNQPILSTTATAKSVEVQSGASLSISSAGSLTINNSKTFNSITTSFGNDGTVQNEGILILGNTATLGTLGLWNRGTFTNTGQISIDRSTGTALRNDNTFTNSASITIGSLTAVSMGLDNQASFSNNACAQLTLFGSFANSSTFAQAGLLTLNTTQAHSNTGFTNTGIIAYQQGPLIPNVTNNDVIAAPISSASQTFSPALQLALNNNQFTIGTTWFTDPGLTQSAGNYSGNTFTASGLAAGTTTILYFAATDVANSCTRTGSIRVTRTFACGLGVVYVTQNGAGSQDGTTWTNALPGTALQMAINTAAVCGAQVWVAAGVYKPTTGTDRTISFAMANGVAIYGGLIGTELTGYNMASRNLAANASTLSGDIDGVADGATGSGSSLVITGNEGNSYHVIRNQTGLTLSAILDGFTIRGGNANATGNNRGGGMHNNGGGIGNFCSPTIHNCLFLTNSASFGGAIYNNSVDQFGNTRIGTSSPQFSNCTVTANNTTSFGTLYQDGTGVTSYTNCVFSFNKASFGGAIAYSTSGTATASHTFLNCLFTGNYAATQGGAIQSGFSFETGTRTVSFTSCSFTDNSTTGGGGGFSNGLLFTAGNTPVFFTNCLFKNNVAHNGGSLGSGGAYQTTGGLTSQRATFTNCVLDGNKALGTADDGGGAVMIYSGTVTLINSTLSNNQAATKGAGISIKDNTGSVSSQNTIFWNNAAPNGISVFNGNSGTATTQYSLFQEAACPPNVTCGAGMIYNQDPRFVNLAGSNLQLTACSPAINAGDPATTPATGTPAAVGTTDLAGQPRFYNGGVVDMGAYEFQGTPGTPVSITSGPVASSVVCEGANISVPVGVTGTVLGYQWYKDGAIVPGQTTATLSLPTAQFSDAGNYSLVVTGCNNSLTSTVFSLSISGSAPVVTLIFGNNATVMGTGVPTITIPPLTNQQFFQATGGNFYERSVVIDRINGYEIRQTDSNTSGIFPINRLGLFSLTVTGAGGCKRTVQAVLQGQ